MIFEKDLILSNIISKNNLLINEILSKIEFKIKPDQNIRKEYIYRIKKRIYKFLNMEKKFINSNTVFSNIDKDEEDAINKLLSIDTMCKISIGFIINQICKNLGGNGVYLNIGVWRGFSMFAGMLNTNCEVYGVDNFSFDYEDGDDSLINKIEESNARKYFYEHLNHFQNKNKHFFFDIEYKEFFKLWEKEKKAIDFYFYDGEHSYQNQYDNLLIANNFLKKGSVILVDDYNELHVEKATLDFVARFDSNFKILREFKTSNKYIHPTYANGIILIEKIN